MAKFSLTLLLLACGTALLTQAQDDSESDSGGTQQAGQAQGQQTFIHPLTNMPGASEDVETSFFFPG